MTKPENLELATASPDVFSGVYATFDPGGTIDLQVECDDRGFSGQEGLAIVSLHADQADELANWLLRAAAYSRYAASNEKAA